MECSFPAFDVSINKGYKYFGISKKPDKPWRLDFCKFPEEVLLEKTACKYQPAPEEKMKAAVANIYFVLFIISVMILSFLLLSLIFPRFSIIIYYFYLI